MKEDLRKQWNDACLNAGLTSITPQKAAKLMAVLLHLGNNEAMVMNKKFFADVIYIQKRYNLLGGLVPDKTFTDCFKQTEREIRESLEQGIIPEWATSIFEEEYEIKLLN